MSNTPGTSTSIFEKPSAAFEAGVFDQPQTAGQEKILADLQEVVAPESGSTSVTSITAPPKTEPTEPIAVIPVVAASPVPSIKPAVAAVPPEADHHLLAQVQLARNEPAELAKLEELIG